MVNENTTPLLDIENLEVSFKNRGKQTTAVDHINFKLFAGEKLGIVGESGSGKSVTCYSILNLLKSNAANRTTGQVIFNESSDHSVDLLQLPASRLQTIRGRRIAMIFQEPMSSLNPVRRCGSQVKEILDVHHILEKNSRKKKVLSLFDQVALSDVERIYHSFPHELSGGQLQRVNIAMALATEPDVIICDEPTTALDVTVQKQILDLLQDIVNRLTIALIFVSHDLDVVGGLCDRVIVMYNGAIVEEGSLPETFKSPQHAYTKALLSCKPTPKNRSLILPTVQEMMGGTYRPKQRVQLKAVDEKSLLEVSNLNVSFPKKKSSIFGKASYVHAVVNVNFSVTKGESLGIVGESGSGKSTIANVISGLIHPTSGTIKYENEDINPHILSKNKALRTKIQLIFQDPYSSLNPRMTVANAILEPLIYHRIVSKQKAQNRLNDLLSKVGLDLSFSGRYPHQLSGGQRQRVCIARALSVNPELLICDECVSALDVSVQAQILNLLDRLKNELNLSLIFISHDLSVVQYICDRVLVMKAGEIVEEGHVDQIISHPSTPYTQQLIESIPAAL